jgi:hypothetical protein
MVAIITAAVTMIRIAKGKTSTFSVAGGGLAGLFLTELFTANVLLIFY